MKLLANDAGCSNEETGNPSADGASQARFFLSGLAFQNKGKPRLNARSFSRAVLIAMIFAILLMDAILPLRDLWFHEALLTQMGPWPVAPSLLLFPGWDVIPPIPANSLTGIPNIVLSWNAVAMLCGAFILVFLVYLFAVHYLPTRISRRFLMRSTLVLALLFMLIPVVTSPDIYSYIAYARLGIMYGQNPLTTLPQAINFDMIYSYVSWVDQPSAYGPTWTLLTSFFQLITALSFLGNFLLAMLLLLRAWGVLMHLGSVMLIWSIAGSLQQLYGTVSDEKRLRATLAFAWNPLLLLEGCTNAHNDTTLLFLVLLMIWFLLRIQIEPETPLLPRRVLKLAARFNPGVRRWLLYLAPAGLMALITCLKINLILLAPGLFLYQWFQTTNQPLWQRLKRIVASLATYAGLIIALYAPFWQGSELLNILSVNPAASRTINSLADAFAHLYNGITGASSNSLAGTAGSPAESFARIFSIGLFILFYAILCWQALRKPTFTRTIRGLVYWMAAVWLLYCALGSPWFWPWYLTTFFGLFALIEVSTPALTEIKEETPADAGNRPKRMGMARLLQQFQGLQGHSGAVRMLVLSMLLLYCFTTWGPQHTFIPGMPGYQWSYLSGAVTWLLPLPILFIARRAHSLKRSAEHKPVLQHG